MQSRTLYNIIESARERETKEKKLIKQIEESDRTGIRLQRMMHDVLFSMSVTFATDHAFRSRLKTSAPSNTKRKGRIKIKIKGREKKKEGGENKVRD